MGFAQGLAVQRLSMELFSEGYFVPPGETYSAIEAPKGKMGVYLVSDGSNRPYRLASRAWRARISSCGVSDRTLADAVAVVGTLDLVFGQRGHR
ncbi:hypothetical protein K523DRAFT_348537 [Schizophyllum commune Tattone D]|nr:hypothetical protein K523DRAFT_348537 [Schizophyllum commune Tattone D]